MFDLLKTVIVLVLFGGVCNECQSVTDLPDNVQTALKLLTDDGLMKIGDVVGQSPDIFEQLVAYWTQNWEETECDWLNGKLPNSVTNEWQYESSTDVITGPLVTWCDIEETFNPFDLSNVNKETVPTDLYNEIAYLLSPEADGNQCLARLKFYVWDIFGIEWNDEFVASLGFESDMALFMTISEQLSGLLKHGNELRTDNDNDNNGNGTCELLEPALLMEPFFEPITQIYGDIFEKLEETSITVAASVGVKLCWDCDNELCFGGGFGFVVNAQREGFLYRESVLNAHGDNAEMPYYYQPQPPFETTESNYKEPETSHMEWVSSTQNTKFQQSEPSMYPSKHYYGYDPAQTKPQQTMKATESKHSSGFYQPIHTKKHQKQRRLQAKRKKVNNQATTEPIASTKSFQAPFDPTESTYQPIESTYSTQNYQGMPQSTNNIHSMEPSSTMHDPSIYPTVAQQSVYPTATMVDPSLYPTIGHQSVYPSQSFNDPSMYPTTGYQSTHSGESYQDPSVYPTAHFDGTQPMYSTEHYQGMPQLTDNVHSNMHSMEPSSIMHNPSVYPTVSQQAGYPSMKYQDPSVFPSQSYDPHSTEQTMYDPPMYPSSSHDDSVYPSATMVDPSIYPTANFDGTQSMHTTDHYQGIPQSTDIMHSMEPSSAMHDPSVYPSAYSRQSYDQHTTQQTMYDPSMYPISSHDDSVYPSATMSDPFYPTVGYETTHSSESYQDPSVYPTQAMYDPSLYPTAYFHETESMHTTGHFQPTMNSEPFDASGPSMTEPTVGSGCESEMHATFYFTLSLYDDINDIQSVELEREFSEELAGQWITDPEMVYDEDGKAVGVTFNAEVAFDADKGIQFAPGTPMAAVVYDTVATLLKEDMSDSEEENDNFENKVMNRAMAINDKRVFEINVFVPMMIVFVAVGTIFVCAAKLYSAYLERKEYEPLL